MSNEKNPKWYTISKHTPGPWIVTPGIENKQNLVIGSPTIVCGALAEVKLPQHNLGFPQLRAIEREANARLIAAAPELLDALRAIINFDEAYTVPPGVTHADLMSAACAAITKAEGRRQNDRPR